MSLRLPLGGVGLQDGDHPRGLIKFNFDIAFGLIMLLLWWCLPRRSSSGCGVGGLICFACDGGKPWWPLMAVKEM